MLYTKNQMKVTEMRILYQHAQITSGAYKFRDTSTAVPKCPEYPDGWRPLTDKEKLQRALAVMSNHINFMQECIDSIGDKE